MRGAVGTCGASTVVAAFLVATADLPDCLHQRPSTVATHVDGSTAHVTLSPDGRYRIAARLDAIDPDFVRALLRREDRRFRVHPGIDPVAILRAITRDSEGVRFRSGASTLTMQLVRVLEPRPRSLRSKVVEAVRALTLEARLSKDEILEAYLTFAPYGRNVEGVEAACQAYFGHGARDLTPEEIATLLAVPQSPSRRFPSPRNAPRLAAARDEIATWLARRGALAERGATAEELVARVRVAPPPDGLRPMPRRAPHAVQWMRARRPGATLLRTTLDPGIQRLAEEHLARLQDEMRGLGIDDGCLVVADHVGGDVRALVGNFDFWQDRPGGQIAAFDEPRSPGSLLKPFLHAMAIDRGLALPGWLVEDVPVSYGGYSPENYSGEHSGLVRLDEALSWSLNVPFVELLSSLGVEPFLGTLRSAGVESLATEPGRYGLSAAVGGIEITPLEVAALHATLAQDGRARPLRWDAAAPPAEEHALFAPGAAWLTRQVLARRDRPDFPMRRHLSGAPSDVHWKTGTSQGHRDAWAAGLGPRYTVVAWFGNLDRRPSVALVGADVAAPVVFDLLEALAEPSRFPRTDPPTADLTAIVTCSASGRIPTEACPERRSAFALTARVPTEPCRQHVAVEVDLATGLAVGPSCREGRATQTRTFVTWPASVRRFLARRERTLPLPPAPLPGCPPFLGGPRDPPRVLSPPPGQVVVLIPGVPPSGQQVPLLADSEIASARHSWFVDGEYLGTLPAEESAWWTPTPGVHRLVVQDETGRAARQDLEVRATF